MTPKAMFTTYLVSLAVVYVVIFLLVFMQVRWEINRRNENESPQERRKRLKYAGLVLIFSTAPLLNMLIPVYFIALTIFMTLRWLWREMRRVAWELRRLW